MENRDWMEQIDRYYGVWRETNAVYEDWARARGLTFNSVLVLLTLWEEKEGCTQKQISQKWQIPKQTVNMIFKDLDQKGLIWMAPMESDRRNKLVHLTETGVGYAGQIVTELRQQERLAAEEMGMERMSRMSEDMALFMTLFRKGDSRSHE